MENRNFNANPYYSPELCDLVIVDSLEKDRDYDFDMVVVWEDLKTGRLYFAGDSGCSCPAPFEDVRGLADFTELNKDNFYSFESACENIYEVNKEECSRFISRFRREV